MIKGVNKKIIEINNTDSLYFEKAVFYLRPNVSVLPEEISRRETERLTYNIFPRTKAVSYSLRKGRVFMAAAVLVAAAAIAAAFFL